MRKHFLKNGLVIGLSLLTLGTVSIPPQAYAAESFIAQEKSIGIVDVNEVLKKVGTYGRHYAGLTSAQQQEIKNAGVHITTSGYGAAANAYSTVEVSGKGSFSGVYGAELIVTTYDVTDENNAQLVNKRTVPIDMD
ncbi:hypothetical protein [Paenibacillus apiarius]|uniref:hypothetical protein n=1 Tax=Paenibacillus apiarius TaxID=46240 RepID=UPI003B3B497F